MVASAFRRQDGPDKVTGRARYAADLEMHGMLHAAFVYSPLAHGVLIGIDACAALAMPGVFGVVSQADVPLRRHGRLVKDRTLFAHQRVRFIGEPVALIAARTPELARRAAAAVQLDIEPLPIIIGPDDAAHPDAPLLHPDHAQYECLRVGDASYIRQNNCCADVTLAHGDATTAMAAADIVIKSHFASDMSHPVPIEPHALVADWRHDRVTIWSASQVPFQARVAMAEVLDLSPRNIRIVVPHLGGGFGGKCEMHFEPHVAILSRHVGRPVKLVLDRAEEFIVNDMTRGPIEFTLETGITREGRIVARRGAMVLDTGAYASHTPAIAEITTMMAVGPYRVPHIDLSAKVWYTNKTPAGSVRSPGGPPTCWALEGHMDDLARAAGIDPAAFRRINLVEDGDRGATGQQLAPVGARACLDAAAETIAALRTGAPGEGIGFACGWWNGATPIASDAGVRLEEDGSATIITGAQENGSGAVMALPMIAADVLGLTAAAIAVVHQDTDLAVFDQGSESSQTTVNNGRAVLQAAEAVAARIVTIAVEMLQSSPDAIILADGAARTSGGASVSFAAVAGHARATGRLIYERASSQLPAMPEIDITDCAGRVAINAFAAPAFFCNAVRVLVDAETGVVQVTDVVAAHDAGHILNHPGAIGQIEGGVVSGVGLALTEGTAFAAGRQINPNLLGYKLMTATDVPRITTHFIETRPDNAGPLGTKGIGEQAIIATAAAIGNAITDATGARIDRLPMTPERIVAALDHCRRLAA